MTCPVGLVTSRATGAKDAEDSAVILLIRAGVLLLPMRDGRRLEAER